MNAILKKETSSNFEHYVCGNCTFPYKTKPEAAACCAAFAREHFQAGLAQGLRLLKMAVLALARCKNEFEHEEKCVQFLNEGIELSNKSDGYPLAWQPSKEGESLV